ncbi:LSU ribosomal protein L17p [Campylobacter jejuni]|nr:LSU ribosomal protein L17p [Campylobacter jejuni]
MDIENWQNFISSCCLIKKLTIALVNSGKIETTLPKAKELRGYVERLITRARLGDFNAHRAVLLHYKIKTLLIN